MKTHIANCAVAVHCRAGRRNSNSSEFLWFHFFSDRVVTLFKVQDKLRLLRRSALFAVVVAVNTLRAFGQGALVVPNDQSSTPGAASTQLPWQGNTHWLQVYDASQFMPLNQGGAYLTAVTFRAEEGNSGGFDVTYSHFELQLATFAQPLDSLPADFVPSNYADTTLVFDKDNVRLTGETSTSIAVPSPFQIRMEFDRPFLYNPRSGHLLMYLRSGSATAPVGTSTRVDTDGFVFPYPARASYPGVLSPNVAVPVALVGQFSYTAVPEPRFFNIAGIALLLMYIYATCKRIP